MNSNEARALILISTRPSVPTSGIAQDLIKISGLEGIFAVSRQYNISASLAGANIESINDCIDEFRRVECVIKTKTLVILKKW